MAAQPTRARRGAWLALAMLSGCSGPRSDTEQPQSDRLFATPAVHAIALGLDPSAMAQLARAPKEWVRATLQADGVQYVDIAVRFKGQRTLRGWAGKPSLKLDFDKFGHKQRRIFGLSGLTLNNMVDDPSMQREQIGARVFEALDVPAPRANYAELFINGERFGLYTLLEPVNEALLARHFGDGSGPLYEGEYGCDLYPDDVWGFEHDGGEDRDRALLHRFARRVGEPLANWFFGPDPAVDRDRVLAYLAASALLADFDGYRHGHNYRIYHDPETRRWSFVPWGFDRILKRGFGIFDMRGRVAARCLPDPDCRLAYVKRLHVALATFEKLEIGELIARNERLIDAAVSRDPRRPYSRGDRDQAAVALRAFVAERPAQLRAQLGCWDGTRELDADADGHSCTDCNDADAAIHPGAVEVCDGLDNDCSGLADDSPSCACPVEQVGGQRYALCDLPMSYGDAERFCAARGDTLASVDSPRALERLKAKAYARDHGQWWVGLSDRGHEGIYVWPDLSRPARGLWARGEPDHFVCGQHCAALRAGSKRGLRDMHCATPAPFICSVGAGTVTPLASAP